MSHLCIVHVRLSVTGVLAGCGGDVSCGDQLETFTVHGWGYGLLQADLHSQLRSHCIHTSVHSSIHTLGLLQADLVEPFLLQV